MGIHKYSSSYADEDYIDIELFCYSITSPSPVRDFEFEFKMCPNFPLHKTSPADQLFFNGKILPLHHLPPRSGQTLQTLLNFSLPQLQNLSVFPTENSDENASECFFDELDYHNPLKKSNWSGKLKHSLLASTAYLKSLFTKSGDEFSCTKASAISSTIQPENFDNLGYMKISKKSPFGDGDNGRFKLSNGLKKESGKRQRRHSLTSWSSSGSSCSSGSSSNSTFSFSSPNELELLKRSRSASNSEEENSIEEAIVYCNKSYNNQQKVNVLS